MNKHIKILIFIFIFITAQGMVSCVDYLDKAPDAGVSEEDAFGDFISFQGFTEELYHCIPDYSKATWVCDWNIADELVATTGANWRLTVDFDNGNYWAWLNSGWGQSYIGNPGEGANTGDGPHEKNLYYLSWYGIRKANVGLENLENLVNATQEEKNTIEGQLLFFRGFLHFQLMSFFGGLPYIDVAFTSEKLDFPRLSYQEMAERVAEDLAAAAELLPANWDNAPVGQRTLGNNQQRITKSIAYAYLGKNLLYAASPLMNFSSTGNKAYDEELCKRAAEAFYNCLILSDNGEAHYALIDWENYEEIIYTLDGRTPGYPETMLPSPAFGGGGIAPHSFTSLYFPSQLGGDGNMVSPAHNYVENFGMANGLPIDVAESGYDPADPWTDRDPRFYKTIVHDGMQVVQGGTNEAVRYANLHNEGNYRNDGTGSRSGYMLHKFVNLTLNNVDNERSLISQPPYLRFADVYYMYAEAVLHGYGTPQSSYPGYITAVEAVNKVRERAGVPGIHEMFLGSKDAFMEELIRERAVELAYEANIRFMDLRRWMIADQLKYREKTAIDFDRSEDGRPINMKERVVITRVFDSKHYWLPLPVSQVNLYPEFKQNPGW
jgi:hypothetical protein